MKFHRESRGLTKGKKFNVNFIISFLFLFLECEHVISVINLKKSTTKIISINEGKIFIGLVGILKTTRDHFRSGKKIYKSVIHKKFIMKIKFF